MKILRAIKINADKYSVVKWFKSLSSSPELYRFDSHQGIYPQKGKIDQPGAIFETREKFLFLFIKLKFQTIRIVEDKEFIFRLIRPFSFLDIYGNFEYEDYSPNYITLKLKTFHKNNDGNVFKSLLASLLFYTPIRILISGQLTKELTFIKNSIEKNLS
ncbi:hypothetical protein JW766_04075 [Candidatus Dojkabacteria bacterium]|nr:hypothetical protein [Candidatus Dojkabacteria bacterium]